MKDTLVQSVKKAAGILDILLFDDIDNRGAGLFEMARKLGLKPNTLHNLLKTLIACGYVEQRNDSKYMAGPKCKAIGRINIYTANGGLNEAMRLKITELSRKIDENVVYTILANGSRIHIIRVENDNQIKVDSEKLQHEHIYEKSTGRILTAYSDEYEYGRIIKLWGYPGERWNNISNGREFEKELEKVRGMGHSVCISNNKELVSIGVPVQCKDGKLAGALGCYAPTYRCGEDKQQIILDELKKTAAVLGSILPV